MPPPVHRMVPRHSYLHISLEEDVRRLHDYAPMIVSFKSIQQVNDDDCDDDGSGDSKGEGGDENENGNGHGDAKEKNDESNQSKNDASTIQSNDKNYDPYPICWFEDEETGTPLRWHFFVGILYDHMKLKLKQRGSTLSSSSKSASSFLPWKIRVHYTSYPASMLPLQTNISGTSNSSSSNINQKHESNKNSEKDGDEDGVSHIIFRHYLNSLKQALYIQHNSNKIVKNMTKHSHLQLWDGIQRCQFDVYNEIANGLNGSGSNITTGSSTGDGSGGGNITLERIPIRVLVNSRAAFGRPCEPYHTKDDSRGSDSSKELIPTTIGSVLNQWLPDLFPLIDGGSKSEGGNSDQVSPKCAWCIQGLQVPLTMAVSDLWKGLCHPDRFLYIIIVTDTV